MARHQEVAPVLKSGTTFHNYGKIAVTLKNIGNFPAQEINTEVELHPNGGKDKLKTHRINPNEQVALVDPFEGVDFERSIQKKYEHFTIRGTCKDMFGRERKIDDKFDLSLLEEGVSRSLDKDKESEKISALDGIAHEIGKINDKLDDRLIK